MALLYGGESNVDNRSNGTNLQESNAVSTIKETERTDGNIVESPLSSDELQEKSKTDSRIRSTKNLHKKRNKLILFRVIGSILMLAVTVGLFYSGYKYINQRLAGIEFATNKEIATATTQIQKTNSENVLLLQGKLTDVLTSMNQIQNVLDNAGKSIKTSSTIQAQLSSNLKKLEAQLAELKKSMNTLQGTLQ